MDRVIRLKAGVEWQQVDDEVVALDLGTSAYVAVNDTGAVLWPMVAAGTTESQLVAELAERYAIDGPRAEADVRAFVEGLRSLSLVDQ